MPGPVFLHGDGVDLRAVEREDTAFLAEHLSDPGVRRRFPSSEPKPVARLDEEFEERYVDGEGVTLLICPRDATDGDGDDPAAGADDTDGEDDPQPVGAVTLMRIDGTHGTAELGYWIAPDNWGAGYATAAARAVLEYAFAERRLERVEANALATNEASRAVIEKLGFVEEGRERAAFHVDGERVDRVNYGLLREEWAD